MRMRKIAVAGLAVLPLMLAACGGDDGGSSGTGNGSGDGASGDGGKVGVILPDAASSPRWESNDRPALDKAITDAGFEAIIQNASDDVSKFSQLCDSMINQGVGVLMIVNLDSESGAACQQKAADAGIASIDYDRLTLGGSADYYVSFDNVQVGKLMGDGLAACLDEAGKTEANIAFINGDPTDNNAALFKEGYAGALQPKIDSGDYKLVGDQTGKWDATVAQTTFEQIFTQNNGNIDGVISANDTMAGGIVTVLRNNKLAGEVPVTGQDASDEGLQRVVAGTQCGTVFKNVDLEAESAAKLAIAILKDDGSADDLVNGEVEDTQAGEMVPSVFATPVWITQDNINEPFDAGYTTVDKVCTADFADACSELGLQ
jgi:D-xylose transport system substrate-binding protein